MPSSASLAPALRCAVAMSIVGASIVASAALSTYPLFGGQAVRYAVAALCLLAVLRWRRLPFVLPSPRQAGRLTALAATGLTGFSVFVVLATRHADPSLVGAVVGATPVVLAVTQAVRERRPAVRTLAAAATVTAGVVLIEGFGSADPLGLALAAGALACEAAFSLVAVPLLPSLGALRVSAYACCAAVPQLVVLGLLAPGPLLAVPSAEELAALAYLAVVVTAVAFLLWYGGLARIGAARAGLFAGLMPVAALATSIALGTEAVTPHAVAGTVLTALGLVLGLLPARRAAVLAGRANDHEDGEDRRGRPRPEKAAVRPAAAPAPRASGPAR
ncbi:DMT family transporter [Isoptericola sp. NEAU-Y5]|uniref:DMT family transporter n=1 Tax=Isoptericola luteus TaxID=2879484 RepID=A0ABS7ZAA4_9MICO|nr:DMT family transporter [Isoptericola sp. NEAU-Y5]MCA5891960.1 DMT family transporter [Isoptericola sp. NEAU-Y5]